MNVVSLGCDAFRHLYEGGEALFLTQDPTTNIAHPDPRQVYYYKIHKVGLAAIDAFSVYVHHFLTSESNLFKLELTALKLHLIDAEICLRICDVYRAAVFMPPWHQPYDPTYHRYTTVLHLTNILRLIIKRVALLNFISDPGTAVLTCHCFDITLRAAALLFNRIAISNRLVQIFNNLSFNNLNQLRGRLTFPSPRDIATVSLDFTYTLCDTIKNLIIAHLLLETTKIAVLATKVVAPVALKIIVYAFAAVVIAMLASMLSIVVIPQILYEFAKSYVEYVKRTSIILFCTIPFIFLFKKAMASMLDHLGFSRNPRRDLLEWSFALLSGTCAVSAAAVGLGRTSSFNELFKGYYPLPALIYTLTYLFKKGIHQVLDDLGAQNGTGRELCEWTFALLTSVPFAMSIAVGLGLTQPAKLLNPTTNGLLPYFKLLGIN